MTEKIYLPLSRGLFASISKEDEHLAQYKWSALQGVNTFYAIRQRSDGVFRLLHRDVLGYDGEDDIDHIDQDGLNNCRSNLRIVPRSFNNLNRVRHSMSGIRERILANGECRYDARIVVFGVEYGFGSYKHLHSAQTIYRRNVSALLNGRAMIAYKRGSRWQPLRKVVIPNPFRMNKECTDGAT